MMRKDANGPGPGAVIRGAPTLKTENPSRRFARPGLRGQKAEGQGGDSSGPAATVKSASRVRPGRLPAARKRTLDAVKLAHANAPFERAADRCDFAYFGSAALCATSTAERRQVKGRRKK